MRRIKAMAAAGLLAAAFAAPATAVVLNPKGLGQVLVYPYYTVNKNQDTLITVGNASDTGKMVRVLFKEGMNGRRVLTFDLFLSPHDLWTARVSQIDDRAGAALFTNDRSCTYPPISAAGAAFSAHDYNGGGANPADGGPTSPERTREGFLTVFSLGEIVAGSPLDAATTHAQTGIPNAGAPLCTADEVRPLAAGTHLTVPDNGLFGSASIVNVGEGTYFAYNSDALADFTDRVLYSSAAVDFPNMFDANSTEAVGGIAIAHVFDGEGQQMLALDYAFGEDAVSAVFMAASIQNEYLVGAGLGANTDWIVTFPTREFYVDDIYTGNGVLPPFTEQASEAQSHVTVTPTIYDQEEGRIVPDEFGGVPAGSLPFQLPWQVNAISFRSGTQAGTPSGVFGSRLTTDIANHGAAGWVDLDLTDSGAAALRSDASGRSLQGLPIVGFMVYNIINSNAAPGRLANYGGVFPHRSSVSCSNDDTGQVGDPCG